MRLNKENAERLADDFFMVYMALTRYGTGIEHIEKIEDLIQKNSQLFNAHGGETKLEVAANFLEEVVRINK